MIRLLTEPTELGSPTASTCGCGPTGGRGRSCTRVEHALHYYDMLGRTWERQAYVKARADRRRPRAGQRVSRTQLEPWIYRRYLSLADITGIKALKRRIEQRAEDAGVAERNVKTGHGGIRDIEFVIQFLQLLNGGDLPEVRTGNTLDAIARLGAGRLPDAPGADDPGGQLQLPAQDRASAADHVRPADARAADRARRAAQARPCGWATRDAAAVGRWRRSKPTTPTARRSNRKILDHLLHDAFRDDAATEPEVDLVNDPDPPPETIEQVLGRYPFRDVPAAYDNLMSLATREAFRSCRRGAAGIFWRRSPRGCWRRSPRTPDPDATLVNLSRVSDSLGGKGVLWELFSFNPPTLEPVCEAVRRVPVPVRHPDQQPRHDRRADGQPALDKLPDARRARGDAGRADAAGPRTSSRSCTASRTRSTCASACATSWARTTSRTRTRALSDIAEACLKQIAAGETAKLTEKWASRRSARCRERRRRAGAAVAAAPADVGDGCELIVLALGKLGGRELNYHSDLDLVFLYEADGDDASPPPRRDGRRPATAFLQRAGPADHQDGQPVRPARPAVRSRPPAAADRAQRRAGDAARRVRPLLPRGRRAALGAAGAVQGPRHRRLAGRGRAGDGRRHRRRSTAARGSREDAAEILRDAAAAGGIGLAAQPQARPRRHDRHRVPRADAAAQARRASGRRSACRARSTRSTRWTRRLLWRATTPSSSPRATASSGASRPASA